MISNCYANLIHIISKKKFIVLRVSQYRPITKALGSRRTLEGVIIFKFSFLSFLVQKGIIYQITENG